MSTVYVIGATSILGWAIVRAHQRRPSDGRKPPTRLIPCCNRHSRLPQAQAWVRLNVEDAEGWRVFESTPPDVVIYCGGICDVDRCEANPRFAEAVNVGGVRAMLSRLPRPTRLVYCSSDHVFGGRTEPYLEDSAPEPVSVYGRTRVVAEELIAEHRPDAAIVRIGLPIGSSLDGKTGHWDWLRYRHGRRLPMTVIADERRCAVWADDVARRVIDVADSGVAGIRHVPSTRACSRPELARYLCQLQQIAPGYRVEWRDALDTPHLGNVVLETQYSDSLAAPLAAVVPS